MISIEREPEAFNSCYLDDISEYFLEFPSNQPTYIDRIHAKFLADMEFGIRSAQVYDAVDTIQLHVYVAKALIHLQNSRTIQNLKPVPRLQLLIDAVKIEIMLDVERFETARKAMQSIDSEKYTLEYLPVIQFEDIWKSIADNTLQNVHNSLKWIFVKTDESIDVLGEDLVQLCKSLLSQRSRKDTCNNLLGLRLEFLKSHRELIRLQDELALVQSEMNCVLWSLENDSKRWRSESANQWDGIDDMLAAGRVAFGWKKWQNSKDLAYAFADEWLPLYKDLKLPEPTSWPANFRYLRIGRNKHVMEH